MENFYKQLLNTREDFDLKNKELAEWKSNLGQDFVAFIKKYEGALQDGMGLSRAEREGLN